jgi:4-diphosphocytidyl-2-C-methyl-D-erythritol kinase
LFAAIGQQQVVFASRSREQKRFDAKRAYSNSHSLPEVQVIERAAPAKINLTLRVLRKRPDGFHDIETLIVPLALADRLTLEEAADWSFSCDDPTIPSDDTNLAVRAARLFFAETGLKPSVRICLSKSIPHGAGLGGGSSDAAATLRMLDTWYKTSLPTESLIRMAALLGSDVPVFINASSAWCRGRGEMVEPASFPTQLPILLLKPAFGIPTPWAYQRWQQSLPLTGIRYESQDFPWGHLENSLERPVFEKHLVLATMKEWLRNQPETIGALMAGSGSTMFAILREPGIGGSLAKRACQMFGPTLWTRETVAG